MFFNQLQIKGMLTQKMASTASKKVLPLSLINTDAAMLNWIKQMIQNSDKLRNKVSIMNNLVDFP